MNKFSHKSNRLLLVGLIAATAVAVSGCREAKRETGGDHAAPAEAQAPASKTTTEFTFTAADAAPLLGVPADTVQADVSELYPGSTMYSFSTADGTHALTFNVTVSESADEAAEDMAQYRSHLRTAAETGPFKGDASGEVKVGDEAVWTEVNGTLTVRKGNVTFQIQMPSEKSEQITIAQALIRKL